MGMIINKDLLSPEQIKQEYPLPDELKTLKEQRDKEIRDIFEGKDDRFIVIIGPCSADREDAVIEYMTKLGQLNEVVKDKLMIIPRVYTNKPRTTGAGYKGMLHQPDVDKEPDLSEGIIAIRKLHINCIKASGLTCADEMLYPANRAYLDDVLSYEAVGARSVENQQHRLTSSISDVPVGMKNPTSGDLSVMINAIKAAQSSHRFIYRTKDVTSTGNDLSHVILRGAVDKHGICHPNYHYEDLEEIKKLYEKSGLKNPAVIIDTNHSNSNKQYKQQIRIARDVLHSRNTDPELKKLVKGFMIESYLVEGCQPITDDRIYGKLITDPCLGWEDTKRLILEIYEKC
ncbi:MAG: 3-deoxy-7-phosphoheptulonate synthase [Firmicutes bacterium]|nr:3-deoxy-7-phosphoheptulonate synthase [Bacillota bacterium]